MLSFHVSILSLKIKMVSSDPKRNQCQDSMKTPGKYEKFRNSFSTVNARSCGMMGETFWIIESRQIPIFCLTILSAFFS